jgi:hypothetical protein
MTTMKAKMMTSASMTGLRPLCRVAAARGFRLGLGGFGRERKPEALSLPAPAH